FRHVGAAGVAGRARRRWGFLRTANENGEGHESRQQAERENASHVGFRFGSRDEDGSGREVCVAEAAESYAFAKGRTRADSCENRMEKRRRRGRSPVPAATTSGSTAGKGGEQCEPSAS